MIRIRSRIRSRSRIRTRIRIKNRMRSRIRSSHGIAALSISRTWAAGRRPSSEQLAKKPVSISNVIIRQPLEAASKMIGEALAHEKHSYKAWCTGNSGSISKHHNAVDGLFRPNLEGRRLFSHIPGLLVTHLAKLNHASRVFNCIKTAVGTTAIIFETASTLRTCHHPPDRCFR